MRLRYQAHSCLPLLCCSQGFGCLLARDDALRFHDIGSAAGRLEREDHLPNSSRRLYDKF
jgi:hypothetical protein